jgi:hypothetical protein
MSVRPPEELKLIARLCQDDQEFGLLWKEHEDFDRQVTEMEGRHYLTPEEELELKRIKKLKLLGKDKIEARLRTHKAASPV